MISTRWSVVRPAMHTGRRQSPGHRSARRRTSSTGSGDDVQPALGTPPAAMPARTAKRNRRHAIVEQAFGLDQHPHPWLGVHLAERRDDRNGVGRGDEDPKQGRADPAPPDQPVHARGNHRGRDRDPEEGERQRERQLAAKTRPFKLSQRAASNTRGGRKHVEYESARSAGHGRRARRQSEIPAATRPTL